MPNSPTLPPDLPDLCVYLLVLPGQAALQTACKASLPPNWPCHVITAPTRPAAYAQALAAMAQAAQPLGLILTANELLLPPDANALAALRHWPADTLGLCSHKSGGLLWWLPRLIPQGLAGQLELADPLGLILQLTLQLKPEPSTANTPSSQVKTRRSPLALQQAAGLSALPPDEAAALQAESKLSAEVAIALSQQLYAQGDQASAAKLLQQQLKPQAAVQKLGRLKIVRQASASQAPPAGVLLEQLRQQALQTAAQPTNEAHQALNTALNSAVQQQAELTQHPLYWSLRGQQAVRENQLKAAIEAFRQALQMPASLSWCDLTLEQLTPALFLGELHLEQGDLIQAESALNALQSHFARHPQGLQLRLKLAALQGQTDQVRALLQQLKNLFNRLSPWQAGLALPDDSPAVERLQHWLALQDLRGAEHAIRYLALQALSTEAEAPALLQQARQNLALAADPWLSLWAAGIDTSVDLQPLQSPELPALWQLFLGRFLAPRQPQQAYLLLENLLCHQPDHQSAAAALQQLLSQRWGAQLQQARCLQLASAPDWEQGGDLILKTWLESFGPEDGVLLCLPCNHAHPVVQQALHWARQALPPDQRPWLVCQHSTPLIPANPHLIWLPRLGDLPLPSSSAAPASCLQIQPEALAAGPVFAVHPPRPAQAGQPAQPVWLELLPDALQHWLQHLAWSEARPAPAQSPLRPLAQGALLQLLSPPGITLGMLQRLPDDQPRRIDYRRLLPHWQPLAMGGSLLRSLQHSPLPPTDWLLLLDQGEWLDPAVLPWLQHWLAQLPASVAGVCLPGQFAAGPQHPAHSRWLCRLLRRGAVPAVAGEQLLDLPKEMHLLQLAGISLLCEHSKTETLSQSTAALEQGLAASLQQQWSEATAHYRRAAENETLPHRQASAAAGLIHCLAQQQDWDTVLQLAVTADSSAENAYWLAQAQQARGQRFSASLMQARRAFFSPQGPASHFVLRLTATQLRQ
ncbi:MAG: hypothetical protein IGS03_16510 [Candidatus Sericytochromatia bacterium]|nr:hypothetical protein [Candidatus Sericytochromatia bacterium]